MLTDGAPQRTAFIEGLPKKPNLTNERKQWAFCKYFGWPQSQRPLISEARRRTVRAYVTESMEEEAEAALFGKLKPTHFASVSR